MKYLLCSDCLLSCNTWRGYESTKDQGKFCSSLNLESLIHFISVYNSERFNSPAFLVNSNFTFEMSKRTLSPSPAVSSPRKEVSSILELNQNRTNRQLWMHCWCLFNGGKIVLVCRKNITIKVKGKLVKNVVGLALFTKSFSLAHFRMTNTKGLTLTSKFPHK